MRKYYYLEIKMYSHLPHGYEFQLADGGEIPRIYRYLKTALNAAKWEIDFSTSELGYEVENATRKNPAWNGDCNFAARLLNKKNDIRKEIRIYELEINNIKAE